MNFKPQGFVLNKDRLALKCGSLLLPVHFYIKFANAHKILCIIDVLRDKIITSLNLWPMVKKRTKKIVANLAYPSPVVKIHTDNPCSKFMQKNRISLI